MSEIEQAARRLQDIADLDAEIKACRDMQLFAKRNNDNITDKAWANKINQLHEANEYIRLKAFIAVMKTYLTKKQYTEAWERVDKILETAEEFNF